MFESKAEIAEAVEAVYALTTGLARGDMLTHEAVSKALGLKPHEGCWKHVIRKVTRRLERERGIAVWPNVRDGYKLCTLDEQLALPVERASRGLRQLRRGRRAVTSLPTKGLTAHQQRARAFMVERTREAESKLRREIKAQRQQLKPTPTIPRRPAA